jgi:hypothetical protein
MERFQTTYIHTYIYILTAIGQTKLLFEITGNHAREHEHYDTANVNDRKTRNIYIYLQIDTTSNFRGL